jgi:hypothetical protein
MASILKPLFNKNPEVHNDEQNENNKNLSETSKFTPYDFYLSTQETSRSYQQMYEKAKNERDGISSEVEDPPMSIDVHYDYRTIYNHKTL